MSKSIRFFTVSASSDSNVFKDIEYTETAFTSAVDSEMVEIRPCVNTSRKIDAQQLQPNYNSRQAHNQAIGKDLANSLEKRMGSTDDDLLVLDQCPSMNLH